MSWSNRFIGVLAVIALGAGSGCVSISSMQSADTLGKGNFQIGAEPGAQILTGVAGYPHIDLSFRYGANDRFDIGGRVGQSFLELQTKVLLTEPGAAFKLSLAPAVGGGYVAAGGAGFGVLNISVPVLAGIAVSDNIELVLGPRMVNWLYFGGSSGGSGSVYAMGVGGSFGAAFGLSESFKLMPEFAVSVPVVGSVSAGGSSASGGIGGAGVVFVQFKLGLLFGKTRPLLFNSETTSAPADDMTPPPPPPPAGDGSNPPPPPPPPAN
ncbi:MAG: hypothetical protein K1X89_23170 [Myxococcaceae bacterium]|nr:hypothetical protein [Myxococcaceae bacterium]